MEIICVEIVLLKKNYLLYLKKKLVIIWNIMLPIFYHALHVMKKLKVLGNNSPSLDIICQHCKRRIEVKSKCLSVRKLPSDLNLPHGNFKDYNLRQSKGLDFIIVIYSVNRIKKNILLREILYLNNDIIKKKDVFNVEKRPSSPLSFIKIKNKNNPNIKKIELKRKDSFISFKKQVIEMINQHH